MLKKTILSLLLFGCLQNIPADPWVKNPKEHRAAARQSIKDAKEIEKKLPRGPYRDVLVNIHNKEAELHRALARLDGIQNRTKLAEKRRRIQDDFRELSGLHSNGALLVSNRHSRAMHRTMARAALRAPGFGSANGLGQAGVFSTD